MNKWLSQQSYYGRMRGEAIKKKLHNRYFLNEFRPMSHIQELMVKELMAVVNGLDESSQQPCRDDTCTINGKSLRTARKFWENISLVTAISMNQPR